MSEPTGAIRGAPPAAVRRDPLPPWPSGALAPLLGARTWLATVHLFLGWVPATVAFVLVTVGLGLGFGLLPLALVGVLFLLATVGVARGFAAFERARFALLLDEHIPAPVRPPPAQTVGRRIRLILTSGVTWRELAFVLFRLPVTTVLSVLANAAWSLPVGLLLLAVLPQVDGWLRLAGPVAGLLLLPAAPWVIRLLAAADTSAARLLIGPWSGDELAGRVRVLEDSRARVVDSAEAERRRIERDLHDGAQQRLVSLAMTLGRAQARYDADPEGARALLAEGQAEARLALQELRDLTRGIHPPVLTDRGLDAALSGLAERCPVPVTVQVEVEPRPSATVESIAYFVVAEALTNVAKHARASCASVAVRRHADAYGDALHVLVLDDGVGGASTERGSGLAGLADRVAGVDGRISLDSPPGGPTVLSVELPCAS